MGGLPADEIPLSPPLLQAGLRQRPRQHPPRLCSSFISLSLSFFLNFVSIFFVDLVLSMSKSVTRGEVWRLFQFPVLFFSVADAFNCRGVCEFVVVWALRSNLWCVVTPSTVTITVSAFSGVFNPHLCCFYVADAFYCGELSGILEFAWCVVAGFLNGSYGFRLFLSVWLDSTNWAEDCAVM